MEYDLISTNFIEIMFLYLNLGDLNSKLGHKSEFQ